VRPQQQVAGEIAHGGRLIPVMAFDRDEQLVLDVGQAGGPRLVFAPAVEAAQGDAEFQQLFEVVLGEPCHCHIPAFFLKAKPTLAVL